jgi:hypothetical protein
MTRLACPYEGTAGAPSVYRRLVTLYAWQVVAAVVVGVVSTARLTRLLLHDAWPPARAFRHFWWNRTAGRGGWRAGWGVLFVGEEPDDPGCPFCLAPWLGLVVLLWGYWSGPDLWWWLFNGWLAGSYVAPMVVLRDEPE